jgi:hypothetical protein
MWKDTILPTIAAVTDSGAPRQRLAGAKGKFDLLAIG